MKKTVLGIVLVVVCAYGGMWLVALGLHRSYDSRQWPGKLGVVADVPARFADAETNAAATKLMSLTPELGISTTPKVDSMPQPKVGDAWDKVKEPLGNYFKAELEREGEQVFPPPADVAAYLNEHQAAIDKVRDHILTAGPLKWSVHLRAGVDAPLPNLLGAMALSKLFTARALMKAANHDVSAWDDLHTIWLLDRELWNRPELISQLIALAGSRMMNSAAAKMPLPAPAWLGELQSIDYRHDFAASYQAEAWYVARTAQNGMSSRRANNFIMRPYLEACAAESAEEMRVRTKQLLETSNCDLTPIHAMSVASWNIVAREGVPNLTTAWQRLSRFRVELESTEKTLALRSGQMPSTKTVCSDGTWEVTPTSVRFTHDIGVPMGVKYPLSFKR